MAPSPPPASSSNATKGATQLGAQSTVSTHVSAVARTKPDEDALDSVAPSSGRVSAAVAASTTSSSSGSASVPLQFASHARNDKEEQTDDAMDEDEDMQKAIHMSFLPRSKISCVVFRTLSLTLALTLLLFFRRVLSNLQVLSLPLLVN